MEQQIFSFFKLNYLEAHLLIILSLGLFSTRFYFKSFLVQKSEFPFSHILILMLFTVFVSILLLFFSVYYHLFSMEAIIQFNAVELDYLIIIPRIIFFFSLASFLYWLFGTFLSKQNYFVKIHQQYTELVQAYESLAEKSLPKDLIDFIHHPDFTSDLLKGFVFNNNILTWSGEHTQHIQPTSDDFEHVLEQIKQTEQFSITTVDHYKIITFNQEATS